MLSLSSNKSSKSSKKFPKYVSTTEKEFNSLGSIVIDFGQVPVFGSYVKTITSKDIDLKDVKSYIVRRADFVPLIYQVFSVSSYEGEIVSPANFKIRVYYNPRIPSKRDLEHFEFIDNMYNSITMTVKGESKGPMLVASVKYLNFYSKNSEVQELKKVVEITNKSSTPADFMFDVNETPSTLFDVGPKSGRIAGQKNVFVTFTFNARNYGSYSADMICLIWGQDPIVINLFAISSKQNIDFDQAQPSIYPTPFYQRVGYMLYFRDSFVVRRTIPPITLSKTYLDFGRIPRAQKQEPSHGHTTSITNHTQNEIEVWYDNDNIFQVTPTSAHIFPNSSTLFEYFISPDEERHFYCKSLTAQIYWQQAYAKPNSWEIPINTKITLLGNSYPEDEVRIPNIRIEPPDVVFEPSLPEMRVFANFKIINLGCMPTIFKFIPPRSSHVIVKPMVGIVRKFQIISAMLSTHRSKKTYSEEWFIELNASENRRVPFLFKGKVSVPSLLFGNDNVVEFEGKVQEGTSAFTQVRVKNDSIFHISFDIRIQLPNYLDFQPRNGIILPNDETYITCQYKALPDAPGNILVEYSMMVIDKSEEYIGTEYTQDFTVIAEKGHAELCGFPKSFDFGSIKMGSVLNTNFHLVNFGDAMVNFELKCMSRLIKTDTIKIKPTSGEVRPRDKTKIDVEIHTNSSGDNEMIILYADKAESAIGDQRKSKDVFRIYYISEVFTIMVEQVIQHNFGHLFGMHDLWNILEIDRLNELWTKGWIGTKVIHINLPECEESNKEYFIILCLRNISHLESEILIKRKQLCSCSLKEVKDTFNIMKQVYDCPHREVMTLDISDSKFYVNSRRFLTLHIKYTLKGKTELAFLVTLGERSVEFRFTITSISKVSGKISHYTENLEMELVPLYVALHTGVIQTFWVYNNTRISSKYSIDVDGLKSLCQKEGAEVLNILNPEGEVEPGRRLPIMIKFHPIELKTYTVTLPITLGVEHLHVRINGKAVWNDKDKDLEHKLYVNKHNLRNFVTVMAIPQCLIFDKITDWSESEQILTLQNITYNKIIQYIWMESGIQHVVDIKTYPQSGILKPKESHRIIVKVKTYKACILTDLLMTCSISDRNEMYLYNKSVELYEEEERKLEGQFLITEKSITTPKNTLTIRENPVFQILTVSVHVNVTDWKDADGLWSDTDKFSLFPPPLMNLNVKNIMKGIPYTTELVGLLTRQFQDTLKIILERLISDFVFSKSFIYILNRAKKQYSPYYSQFMMESKLFHEAKRKLSLNNELLNIARQEEVEHLCYRPPSTLLSHVMRALLFEGIHRRFKLGAAFPKEQSDKEIDNEIGARLKLSLCGPFCHCQPPD